MKATIKLFPWELESMPEYSTSLPTGTTVWKMWKRKIVDQWVVGQYIPCEEPGMIGTRWYEVLLKEGTKPAGYVPPDWSNYARWKKDREAEKAV